MKRRNDEHKNSYRADLSIDKHNIDEEILRQPQLYYHWSQLAAEAEVDRDEAKEAYDIALIDIENRVRTQPHLFFGEDESTTEGAIKTKVNSHRKIRKLRKKYHEAQRVYKLLRKAESAFEQRKRMIESYLYHYHKMIDSDVHVPKVPATYERRVNRETRESIKRQLRPSMRGKKND